MTTATTWVTRKTALITGITGQDGSYLADVLSPANPYGPGDNFDLESSHVVPAIIRARAIVLAAERYDASEPVNVGTGEDIAIRDLAARIASAMGWHGRFVWDTARPNGQPRRRLDVHRARERFGFTADVSLAGLKRTIDWWQTEGRAAS